MIVIVGCAISAPFPHQHPSIFLLKAGQMPSRYYPCICSPGMTENSDRRIKGIICNEDACNNSKVHIYGKERIDGCSVLSNDSIDS